MHKEKSKISIPPIDGIAELQQTHESAMTARAAFRMAQRISLRQLQIFEAVARLNSFTAAARELHLTQPTVSMQVAKLADALGLELLEQAGRGVRLTAQGRRVHELATDILSRVEGLSELAQALRGEVSGDLRIATVTSATYFLPHILGAFLQRYPQVEPFLSVTNRAQVIERLRTGADDLIIMGRAPQELDVVAHPFLDNELVVIAPHDHPLKGQRSIALQLLAAERFLVRERGSGTRLAVDSLFAEHGLAVRPTMELGSAEAMKQAVLAGLGISVLPRQTIQREAEAGALCILDVEHFPLVRQWFAVHLKRRRLSLVAQKFLDYLLEGRPGQTQGSSSVSQ